MRTANAHARTGRKEHPMSDSIMPIPPEDQPAWSDLLGLEPVRFICDKCKMPAARAAAGWVHVEAADAAFCALIFGTNTGE